MPVPVPFFFFLYHCYFSPEKNWNLTKRRDYYNNHRQDKIRGKTAHVRNTRSPATSWTHKLSDPDLIPEICTTQESRGTPVKAIADTIHTPPRAAPPRPPPVTSPFSHPSKSQPHPDPPSLMSNLHVTQTTTKEWWLASRFYVPVSDLRGDTACLWLVVCFFTLIGWCVYFRSSFNFQCRKPNVYDIPLMWLLLLSEWIVSLIFHAVVLAS